MFKCTNLDQFPFPWTEDNYRYSNDLKTLENPYCIEITPEYAIQIKEKRRLLDEQPEVRYQSFPHTMEMQWELVELLLEQAVERYPQYFSVEKNDEQWTFTNQLLNETETFIFGDSTSITREPLDLIGRHFTNDFVLMVHRDNDILLEVGQVSFAALFSVNWNKGMSYTEIHKPVPFVSRTGVPLAEKIRQYLLRLEPGKPWTRINWNLMANRWDVNYETMHIWEPQRELVNKENAGKLVYLRVEEQKFYRLPRSNSILFSLNTQFLPLEDLQMRPDWLERTYKNLSDIPPEMAKYKGIDVFLNQSVEYLKELVEEPSTKEKVN